MHQRLHTLIPSFFMSTPWLFLCLNIKIKRGLWKINELCKICVIQFRIRTWRIEVFRFGDIQKSVKSRLQQRGDYLGKIQIENYDTAVFPQLNEGQILSSQQLAISTRDCVSISEIVCSTFIHAGHVFGACEKHVLFVWLKNKIILNCYQRYINKSL